jgi:hypothetical protein
MRADLLPPSNVKIIDIYLLLEIVIIVGLTFAGLEKYLGPFDGSNGIKQLKFGLLFLFIVLAVGGIFTLLEPYIF